MANDNPIQEISHSHCPYEHEHPQPFMKDGDEICGRCYFVEHIITIMVPCTPEICNDV